MSKEYGGIVKAWEATVRKTQAAAKRRANSIFPTMSVSVAHSDDDDSNSGAGDLYHAERVFSNGDYYIGQWADNNPHGNGKYLWADGCMYVGDWYKGKTMGKGKFSWPSGATYEGQFKNGYMDGEGTYSSSDTYKGSWMMNLKHGKGTKKYANGDFYDGEWRRGMQEGQGRYQWNNGNQYIGHWRNGKMSDTGTMIWANGNRYDGCWDDGLPKGNGTFRWDDGSFYVGVWSKDLKEQSGTYYPSGSRMGNFDWDPQQVYLDDLNDCEICAGEKVSVLPSQKVLNLGTDGEFLQKQLLWKSSKSSDGKPKRLSVDGRLSNGSGPCLGSDAYGDFDFVNGHPAAWREGEEGLGNLEFDDLDTSRGIRMQTIRIQPMKKQGETISKGHKNYELMLNLQLGIRYS